MRQFIKGMKGLTTESNRVFNICKFEFVLNETDWTKRSFNMSECLNMTHQTLKELKYYWLKAKTIKGVSSQFLLASVGVVLCKVDAGIHLQFKFNARVLSAFFRQRGGEETQMKLRKKGRHGTDRCGWDGPSAAIRSFSPLHLKLHMFQIMYHAKPRLSMASSSASWEHQSAIATTSRCRRTAEHERSFAQVPAAS